MRTKYQFWYWKSYLTRTSRTHYWVVQRGSSDPDWGSKTERYGDEVKEDRRSCALEATLTNPALDLFT